jgi:diacylglycerol kinase family enzyme
MKIAPRAKMDDGLLDLCIVEALNPMKLFCLFPTVYFGKHLQVREVHYSQASKMRVETEFPVDVYADGEFVCRTPAEIATHRAALKVIVEN